MCDPYHKGLGSRDSVFSVGCDWILGEFVALLEKGSWVFSSWTSLCNDVLNMTQMLSSNFMHLIGLILTLNGQKVFTVTVFWLNDSFAGISLVLGAGKFGVA